MRSRHQTPRHHVIARWGAESPERLAHEFTVIIDGAIVAALITRDPKIADVARRTAEAVIMRERRESASPASTDSFTH